MSQSNARGVVGKPCPETSKRKFASKVEVFVNNARNPQMIRAYRCPYCGFWHGSRKR